MSRSNVVDTSSPEWRALQSRAFAARKRRRRGPPKGSKYARRERRVRVAITAGLVAGAGVVVWWFFGVDASISTTSIACATAATIAIAS